VAKIWWLKIFLLILPQINCKKKRERTMSNVIGRNLKVLREANDLTQEQMSSYLGIGRSAYANYEAGEREAPLEVLERSASLLGCELDLLFEEDVETVKDQMMVCAFRTDGLTEADMKEVARFKQVVLEYMKMQKMLSE
jgi:transcriptional regulator with XRE-family HTH domain